MPTFNGVFENQRIASGMLTQPCRYKRAESNFPADEKDPDSCLVIHLYYKFIEHSKSCKNVTKNL